AANAVESLNKKIDYANKKANALIELQSRLRLKRAPRIIEAFDISNLGSTNAVGAMVVFRDGEPDKGSYRKYRIKDVKGQDDYAMIKEMLARRYRPADAAQPERPSLPDLILVDGGKGQLNSALAALSEIGVRAGEDVEIISLAKDGHISAKERFVLARNSKAPVSKGERVFLPNVKDPLPLKEGTRPDLLLRRIRDEVHRYVIGFHRSVRSRAMVFALDAVPGVGPALRTRLLEKFGDLNGVLNATTDELVAVKGITRSIAAMIHELKI
ncbi:MAG: helix-hairpin-helix domain-containing protein, partial [Nitrospirota bacterium]|nr:helix-hairpin-helix domain-containing protein [Nitrospirota bacterium]